MAPGGARSRTRTAQPPALAVRAQALAGRQAGNQLRAFPGRSHPPRGGDVLPDRRLRRPRLQRARRQRGQGHADDAAPAAVLRTGDRGARDRAGGADARAGHAHGRGAAAAGAPSAQAGRRSVRPGVSRGGPAPPAAAPDRPDRRGRRRAGAGGEDAGRGHLAETVARARPRPPPRVWANCRASSSAASPPSPHWATARPSCAISNAPSGRCRAGCSRATPIRSATDLSRTSRSAPGGFPPRSGPSSPRAGSPGSR